MKKAMTLFLLSFFILGIMANSFAVFAEENNSGNSGTSGSRDVATTTDDEAEIKDEVEGDEQDDVSGKDRVKEKIKERIKEKDGEIERKIKGRFIDENGNVVKFERKIKVKNGNVEIETKLKIKGEGSNLSVEDSEGKKHRVRVTPEKLKTLMLERLNADNVTNFSLEEIKHKNIPRVVYKINSEHPGRFLGIFKLAMKAETQVDTETGEVISINTPWWAFLVTEQLPPENEVVGNESLAEEIVADEDELEEEFENVELEGENLEIKAKTLGGKSEIEIELEFNTQTTGTDSIVSEVLNKLTLSSEEVDILLKIVESEESIEEKEELEFEIETKDDSTEVEFELQFSIDSDSKDEIISAIMERISTLTSEQIKNALASSEGDGDEDDEEETEDESEDEEAEPIALN